MDQYDFMSNMNHPEFVPWVIQNPDEARNRARRGIAANTPTAEIPDDDDKRVIQVAISSLSILWICGVHHRLDGPPDLEEMWADIYAWVIFLDSHCASNGVYIERLRAMCSRGENFQAGSLQIIPLIIWVLCSRGPLRNTILASRGILTMLARRWVEGGLGQEVRCQQDWALALNCVLLGPERRSKSVLEEIVGATDGGAEVISQIAVGRVRTFLSQSLVDYHAMSPHLGLMDAFSSSLVRPLRFAMLCQRSLPTLIEVLNLINNDDTSTSSPQTDCIVNSYSSIIEALQSVNGATWISQALDAGLLPALLKSGARLQGLLPLVRDSICKDLFKVLHQYLPYRSVLRSVARALQKVDRLNITAEAVGPLWNAWKQFHGAAMVKLIFKEEFDQKYPSAISAVMIGCMNTKTPCSRGSDAQAHMRCSSCLQAIYCTKSCQKEHWPEHRKLCKETQQRLRDGVSMPLHLHDRNFIQYQTSRDIYRHPLLIEDIKANWPSPVQQPLCLEMDYLEVPPKLLVQSVLDYDWKPGYEVEERERYLQRAKEEYEQHNKRAILVCVIIRDGDYKNRYPMLFDIDYEA